MISKSIRYGIAAKPLISSPNITNIEGTEVIANQMEPTMIFEEMIQVLLTGRVNVRYASFV